MKRTIASAAALCLALGLVLTGCGSKDKAVYVQQVSSLTGISSQDRFSGLVVSENLMEIKKDSDKEVAELLVKEGQDVQEGDPLFSYDTDQLQLNADKLDLEREQRLRALQRGAVKGRELAQQVARLGGVGAREARDGIERVEEEMRVDLRLQRLDLGAGGQLGLAVEFVGRQLRGQQLREAARDRQLRAVDVVAVTEVKLDGAHRAVRDDQWHKDTHGKRHEVLGRHRPGRRRAAPLVLADVGEGLQIGRAHV